MNYELDSILHEKYERQPLTEEDFILFKENDYLDEVEFTNNEMFRFSIDDYSYIFDSNELRYISPYAALFYFRDGKFASGTIIPYNAFVKPSQVRSNVGDKVYFTTNIKVLKYDKHYELKKKIRVGVSILAPIVLTSGVYFSITAFKNIFANICAILALLISWVIFWTVGVRDYKIIKIGKLSRQNQAYFQFGKNQQSLEEYCRTKEEEKYKIE